MFNDPERKPALVLSGGGAYGAYEVGVIKALFEGKSRSTFGVPLDPAIYTGTSVGNYNAAFLAMNEVDALESINQLHTIWTDRIADNGDGLGNGVYKMRWNPFNYIDPRVPGSPIELLRRLIGDTTSLGRAAAPRLANLLAPDEGLSERMKDLFNISAFLNVEPFRRLIEDTIKPSALRTSKKILKITATGWLTGIAKEFCFPNTENEKTWTDEETWAAIRASAAIPALFPPVKLLNEVYIDGGVVQNTPIKPAVKACATELHVVSLNPEMARLSDGRFENTLDTFNRVYAAMLVSRIDEDVASAKWVNEGIEALERIALGHNFNLETMRQFVRVAGVISSRLEKEKELPRKLTIHRYFPNRSLGDMLGMLNFHRRSIDDMIRDGYADTCAHNCDDNKCVIPAVVEQAQPVEARAASTV